MVFEFSLCFLITALITHQRNSLHVFVCSIAIYHKNLFGRNQKINLSLERGQIDSIFRMNYTDPWIEGDDKRTSRAIMIQVTFAYKSYLYQVNLF